MSAELTKALRLGAGADSHPRSEKALMLRAMGFLFLAGGGLAAIWLFLPHPAQADEGAIWSLVALSTVMGAAMVALAERLPHSTPLLADAIGMVMIGVAVHLSGQTSTVFAVMFVWVAAYNAYFFAPRTAGFHFLALGVIYAVALALHPQHEAGWVSRWLVTMVALGVTSVLISLLVRARREAERSREHLAALVADSDEAIVSESLEGLVLSWNRGAEALFGYVAEEMVGEPMSKLIPDGYDDAEDLLARVRDGSRVLDHETVRRRKDGSMVAVSLTISPVHDATGRVTGASTVTRDISRHKELELQREALLAQSRREALTDPLTGLANRRSWDRELEVAVGEANRAGGPFCVALIDLDHFKSYNDRHGHLAGDRLLREAASAWRSLIRDADLIARFGGEEFAVLLPNCTASDGQRIVERLRTSTPRGQRSSAGLTAWTPGDSAENLTARADAALYAAKRAGRDRLVALASPESAPAAS